VLTKVIEPIIKVIAQHVKPTRIPLKYLCIICSNCKHHAPNCLKKAKIQNMFWTKPTTTTIVVTEPYKPYNVLVNVVVAIVTCSQVLE
jgi:hypothetical protein